MASGLKWFQGKILVNGEATGHPSWFLSHRGIELLGLLSRPPAKEGVISPVLVGCGVRGEPRPSDARFTTRSPPVLRSRLERLELRRLTLGG